MAFSGRHDGIEQNSDQEHLIVNCHTHLELGWLSELYNKLDPPTSFSGWLRKLVQERREQRQNSMERVLAQKSIETAISELQKEGTTHIGDVTRGYSIEPLLHSGLRGVVYIEIFGNNIQGGDSLQNAVKFINKFRHLETEQMRIGLNPHSVYGTDPKCFPGIIDLAKEEARPVCIHVAESLEEIEALQFKKGPLLALMDEVGNRSEANLKGSIIKYLEEIGFLELKPLLIHAVNVSESDLDIISAYGAKIAHCPRSNHYLNCGPLNLELVVAKGISTAFGTDSLASSPSLNVLDELQFATQLHGARVPKSKLIEMVSNSAVLV